MEVNGSVAIQYFSLSNGVIRSNYMTEYYSFYQGLPQNVCLDTAFGMLRINNLNLHGQSKQAHTHTHTGVHCSPGSVGLALITNVLPLKQTQHT